MLILKAQNVVSEGIPIVYVYQMHQQNGSFAQNVDSEDIPGSTNGVNRKARNNKLDGDRAPPTSTNVLIYKMGWPPRLQFLAPFHISCNPDINKVGNRSYMASPLTISFNTIEGDFKLLLVNKAKLICIFREMFFVKTDFAQKRWLDHL